MRVLDPRASAFLSSHGVEAAEGWRVLGQGEPLPSHVADKVLMGEAVRHVAATRRAAGGASSSSSPPPDATLEATRGDHPSYACMRRPVRPPPRYSFQLDVHASLFPPTQGGSGPAVGRSGMVVLPCGAGKTHVGKHAAYEVRGPTLVLGPNHESLRQWEAAFAGVPVRLLGARPPSSSSSPSPPDAWTPPPVTLATYKLMSRSADAPLASLPYEVMLALYVWKYELLVLDEAHTVPAASHRRLCGALSARMRIGLTADERRCDGNEKALASLVGPVRYHLPLPSARAMGIIARAAHRVVEVSASPSLREMYALSPTEPRRLLATLNPRKVHALLSLLSSSSAGRVVVFCDKVRALPFLSDALRRAEEDRGGGRRFVGVLAGNVPREERRRVCDAMRSTPRAVALFTAAGNAAVDVPALELLVEVSVVEQSAQQDTQRRGRAQRVAEGKASAEVVTLVTAGTHEVGFARRRLAHVRAGLPVEWVVEEEGEAARGESDAASLCPWTDARLAAMVGVGEEHDRALPPPKRARHA